MTAKELVNEALAEVRKANALKAGKIKQVEKDCVAYNVEDTTGEPRPTGEGQNWDDYWKYWTNEKFTDATCACCGCALNDDIRVGAHVRLKGEPDNTKDAWIALYCKGCNNPGSGGTSCAPNRLRSPAVAPAEVFPDMSYYISDTMSISSDPYVRRTCRRGRRSWALKSGVRVPPKTFQLRSQFRGGFAIIHESSFLVGVRTSHYSEDRPRRTTIFIQKRSRPRGASQGFGSTGKNWGTSSKNFTQKTLRCCRAFKVRQVGASKVRQL